MPFAIEKRISFSALSSKMNWRFGKFARIQIKVGYRAGNLLDLKGLGHEIEFKFFDKMSSFMEKFYFIYSGS
jgi:predicted metal-dependent hydrolase